MLYKGNNESFPNTFNPSRNGNNNSFYTRETRKKSYQIIFNPHRNGLYNPSIKTHLTEVQVCLFNPVQNIYDKGTS